MFLLPKNKALFNTGTLGAQPAVVYETVAQYMRKVAAEIASPRIFTTMKLSSIRR
jgi:hypothetical protein